MAKKMLSKHHPPKIFSTGHISATIDHSEIVHHFMFGDYTSDQSFFSRKDTIQPTGAGILATGTPNHRH